jgi:hypothetical protein
MRLVRRKSVRFALILVPALALLAWPFAFAGRGCRAALCWTVNRWILTSTDGPEFARLSVDARSGFEWQVTEVVWNNPSQLVLAKFDVDIHQTLYFPFMVFVALSLTSRLTFGNKYFLARWEILGLALLLVRGFLRYMLLERWTDGLAHDGPFDMFLQLLQLALAAPRGMTVAFPLILWLVLSRKALRKATSLGES